MVSSRIAWLIFLAWLLMIAVASVSAKDASPSSYSIGVIHKTNVAVRATRVCQQQLDRDRPPQRSASVYARTRHMEVRLWALRLWRGRLHRCVGLTRHLNAKPPRAIRYVFQRLGSDDVAIALDVAGDEAGSGDIWAHPFCTTATNGQYEGCFQMGDWARSRYGHGPTALDQAWAAYAYRVEAHGWCSGWSATADVC